MLLFAWIPVSKDYRRTLQENMKRTNWLSSVLRALGGPGNENESLLNLFTYVGRTETRHLGGSNQVKWAIAAQI